MSEVFPYRYLDSGQGRKLEQFGPFLLDRPAAQALWEPQLSREHWQESSARFSRLEEAKWERKERMPSFWPVQLHDLQFKVAMTDFGHLGLFPEHAMHWQWLKKVCLRKMKILNLFAYSGATTLFLARLGASVCHVDASKGMVAWARENSKLNGLEKAAIRWIVDDVSKFLKREIKRGSQYDAVILDPPSFGRGAQGQVFKIEKDLAQLLLLSLSVLTDKPHFCLFTSHTPSLTPLVLANLLEERFGPFFGKVDFGEQVLQGENTYCLPMGSYARWSACRS